MTPAKPNTPMLPIGAGFAVKGQDKADLGDPRAEANVLVVTCAMHPTHSECPVAREPLLSGSAGITALALVIALSVYLRNVSANTQEAIEDTMTGDKPAWPVGKAFTTKRLAMLSDTRQIIENITPAMFALALTIGLRITIGAIPAYSIQRWFSSIAPTCDAILLGLLTLGIAMMWRAHQKLKFREIPIRNEMYFDASRSELIRRSIRDYIQSGVDSLST